MTMELSTQPSEGSCPKADNYKRLKLSSQSASFRSRRIQTLFVNMALAASCVPETFAPTLFGGLVLSLEASVVDLSTVANSASTQPSASSEDVSFCNVTVTYTHPGQNDSIIVETWLPVDNWNERFLAVGGGGWNAGRTAGTSAAMAAAIADGYATVTTDAGLGSYSDPSPWVNPSPGNVNMQYLQNFATSSLNDEVELDSLTHTDGPELTSEFLFFLSGNHWKIPCSQLLWQRPSLLLLERLLHWGSPGSDYCSEVSRYIRWHRVWSAGHLLDQNGHGQHLAAAVHEHARILSLRMRTRSHCCCGCRSLRRPRWRGRRTYF